MFSVQSIYDDEVIDAMPVLVPMLFLGDPPTMEELETALSQPTLFNIYFNAMVTRWCSQCGEAGVPILYKHGREIELQSLGC